MNAKGNGDDSRIDITTSVRFGSIVITGVSTDGNGDFDVIVSPAGAVELWRCLTGEKDNVSARINGTWDPLFLAYYDDSKTWAMFTARDRGHVLAKLDANEAYALAWALKRCVEDALFQQEADGFQFAFTETKTRTSVWVLSCRRILTGDCAETNGSEMIGGYEEVYLSRTSATENVREFIRPLVNEAYSESYWDNCERDVDDILDEIMDKCCELSGNTYWRHDGQTQSFEVKLAEREVNP